MVLVINQKTRVLTGTKKSLAWIKMNSAQERKAQALREGLPDKGKKNEVYVKNMSGLGKKCQ